MAGGYVHVVGKNTKESKYWHFRCNDMTEEQFEKLKNMKCEWIRIGEKEKNVVRGGYHFHAAIKFERSVGISIAKYRCLFNKDLHTDNWYLATKYMHVKNDNFMNYCIKEGIRFDSKDHEEVKEVDADDEIVIPEAKQVVTKEDKLAKKKELDDNRLHKARVLDYSWFLKYDRGFFFTPQFKNMAANCQHKDGLKNLNKKDNVFLTGPPGVGKSSLIDFLFPGCYRKLKTNEKWDSYSNYLDAHKTVYFDEMDTLDEFDDCLGRFSEFATITDVYPFPVRSNYGSVQLMIRPERFIITSNFNMGKILATENKHGRHVQHVEMLKKRFSRRFMEIDDISVLHLATGTYFDKIAKRTKWVSDTDKERWLGRGDEGLTDFVKRQKNMTLRFA